MNLIRKIEELYNINIDRKTFNIKIECEECHSIVDKRYDHAIKSVNKFKKILCGSCALKQKRPNRKKPTGRGTITKTCKYCYEDFTIRFGQRKIEYCSKTCASKDRKRSKEKIRTSRCIICNKEFEHYGERIVCSLECNRRYMSEKRLGEKNPNWNENKTEERECKECKRIFKYTRSGLHTDQKRIFCSKECNHSFLSGKIPGTNLKAKYENSYPSEFKKIREYIIARDDKKCTFCSEEKNLHVHHIDYNKENNREENLITLCERCHCMTNSHVNRTFFEVLFSGIISNSKIVKKGWGLEVHLSNNNEYCLKYLIFFEGKNFSLHYHEIKKELWHCLLGNFVCEIADTEGNIINKFNFKKGDKIELVPGVAHRLYAINNSIITEVSTPDYPEDSIRIEKGD